MYIPQLSLASPGDFYITQTYNKTLNPRRKPGEPHGQDDVYEHAILVDIVTASPEKLVDIWWQIRRNNGARKLVHSKKPNSLEQSEG
jgi:hypothetical protein